MIGKAKTIHRRHRQHRCPECGAPVEWEGNRYRPFCSNRCKQIDLGKWLREEYSVPVYDFAEIVDHNAKNEAIH